MAAGRLSDKANSLQFCQPRADFGYLFHSNKMHRLARTGVELPLRLDRLSK